MAEIHHAIRRRLIGIIAGAAWLLLPSGLPALAAQNLPGPDQIWSVEAGKAISFRQLLDEIATHEIILIGETHGVSGHQNREAFIIGALAERGRYPSLGLEMLSPVQESGVAALRRAEPEDAASLGIALDWQGSGWPDYGFYRPVFEAAFRAKLPILGLDLGEDARRAAKAAPALADAGDAVWRSWSQTMAAAHCDMIAPSELEAVTRLQIARDAFMAERIASAMPVLAIAGSEHMRKDRGIPALLARRGIRSTVIGLVAYSRLAATEAVAGRLYDYVWFTGAPDRKGSCERLREKGLIR